MKYLLTLLIISSLSCSKDSNNTKPSAREPSAKNITCKTIYSSPSVPNINWNVTLEVPDTNAVVKLIFKRVTPAYIAFEISKPKTQSYTVIQPGYASPSYNDQANFYFEWQMTDGTKKQESPFQVWEK